MSNETIYIIMGVTVGLFVLIVLAYYILSKKMQKSEYKAIQRLQKGTKQKKFSLSRNILIRGRFFLLFRMLTVRNG